MMSFIWKIKYVTFRVHWMLRLSIFVATIWLKNHTKFGGYMGSVPISIEQRFLDSYKGHGGILGSFYDMTYNSGKIPSSGGQVGVFCIHGILWTCCICNAILYCVYIGFGVATVYVPRNCNISSRGKLPPTILLPSHHSKHLFLYFYGSFYVRCLSPLFNYPLWFFFSLVCSQGNNFIIGYFPEIM